MTYRSPYDRYSTYYPVNKTVKAGDTLSWVAPISTTIGISIYDSAPPKPDIQVGDEVEIRIVGKVTQVDGGTVTLDNNSRKKFVTSDIKSGVLQHKLVKRPKRRPSPGEEFKGYDLHTWTFPKGTIISRRSDLTGAKVAFALDSDKKWVSLQGASGRSDEPYFYTSYDFGGTYKVDFIPSDK